MLKPDMLNALQCAACNGSGKVLDKGWVSRCVSKIVATERLVTHAERECPDCGGLGEPPRVLQIRGPLVEISSAGTLWEKPSPRYSPRNAADEPIDPEEFAECFGTPRSGHEDSNERPPRVETELQVTKAQ